MDAYPSALDGAEPTRRRRQSRTATRSWISRALSRREPEAELPPTKVKIHHRPRGQTSLMMPGSFSGPSDDQEELKNKRASLRPTERSREDLRQSRNDAVGDSAKSSVRPEAPSTSMTHASTQKELDDAMKFFPTVVASFQLWNNHHGQTIKEVYGERDALQRQLFRQERDFQRQMKSLVDDFERRTVEHGRWIAEQEKIESERANINEVRKALQEQQDGLKQQFEEEKRKQLEISTAKLQAYKDKLDKRKAVEIEEVVHEVKREGEELRAERDDLLTERQLMRAELTKQQEKLEEVKGDHVYMVDGVKAKVKKLEERLAHLTKPEFTFEPSSEAFYVQKFRELCTLTDEIATLHFAELPKRGNEIKAARESLSKHHASFRQSPFSHSDSSLFLRRCSVRAFLAERLTTFIQEPFFQSSPSLPSKQADLLNRMEDNFYKDHLGARALWAKLTTRQTKVDSSQLSEQIEHATTTSMSILAPLTSSNEAGLAALRLVFQAAQEVRLRLMTDSCQLTIQSQAAVSSGDVGDWIKVLIPAQSEEQKALDLTPLSDEPPTGTQCLFPQVTGRFLQEDDTVTAHLVQPGFILPGDSWIVRLGAMQREGADRMIEQETEQLHVRTLSTATDVSSILNRSPTSTYITSPTSAVFTSTQLTLSGPIDSRVDD